MIKPTTLRQLAIGISLPTFTVSPAVAKATIYMPSQVAARMLGGRGPERRASPGVEGHEERVERDTSHAA